MIEVEPIPTRWQTMRSIVIGLMPYQGDLFNVFDGLEFLLRSLKCFGVVLVRIVMMALLPVTVLVMFPIVRAAQRRKHEYDLGEADRRAELIAKLAPYQSRIRRAIMEANE